MRTYILLALLCAAPPASAAVTPSEHDFVVRNFRFESGETMPEVRIHYLTYGTRRGNNAVLILHGTGGSSRQFLGENFAEYLFRPGGLLDASRYFIVIPTTSGTANPASRATASARSSRTTTTPT